MNIKMMEWHDFDTGVEFCLYLPADITTTEKCQLGIYSIISKEQGSRSYVYNAVPVNDVQANMELHLSLFMGVKDMGGSFYSIESVTNVVGEEMLFQAKLSGDTEEVLAAMMRYKGDS